MTPTRGCQRVGPARRAQPEDGYHLSKDLADKAISYIADSRQSQPDKPWYMWYCPGANHAPHHAPQEYIDKYKGKFDDGYEAYRGWVLTRMIERGILPKGTQLTPLNPMTQGTVAESDAVRPWNSLSAEEGKLFSRMAEVFAGYSEYTDAQIGRVIDYLEQSGQLDNTLIIYAADNGASGEGSPNGSVNENRFFNAYPDDMESNLAMMDKLGSPETYNHYPTGWAVAFSTPYRMFKRYSGYAGVQLARGQARWIWTFVILEVLVVLYTFAPAVLWLHPRFGLSIGAATGIAGGTFFQVFVLFPIWGSLAGLWAARRLSAQPFRPVGV